VPVCVCVPVSMCHAHVEQTVVMKLVCDDSVGHTKFEFRTVVNNPQRKPAQMFEYVHIFIYK